MPTRRQFLQGAAAAGALGVLRSTPVSADLLRGSSIVEGATAPFDHVIVLMFENRSFDHLLGWLPDSDGVQAGLRFTDQTGTTYPTYPLAPDPQGCGYLDPDHSWEGFVRQLNGGAMDGWLKTPVDRGVADTFPIGYYGPDDVPVIASLARSYTTLDNYFASFAGETFPNRFYQHAARTDRDHNMGVTSTSLSPTIWDRLANAGVSAGYYFVDESFMGLWGTKYLSITHPVAEFLAQAATGTLPSVSFVDPSFANEDQGQSGDYHPHGNIHAAEAFLSTIYHAVRSSPTWDRTVLVINFDECGGFFDHVVPGHAEDDTVRAALTPTGVPVPDYTQLGFRVPCIVVSPWSNASVVSDGPYEHTSVLKMIEWRWGLAPLTARDAHANNLADVLDFKRRRDDSPAIPVVASFVSAPCGPTSVARQPPAPVGPPGSSHHETAEPASASLLPTSSASPLALGAAALGTGMALRAAHRRAQDTPITLTSGGAEPEVVDAVTESS